MKIRILYITIAVLVIVAIITIIILRGYNKLILLKNKIAPDEKNLEDAIKERFTLASQYSQALVNIMDTNTLGTLNTLISRFGVAPRNEMFKYLHDLDSIIDSINIALANANINQSPIPEWQTAFVNSKTKIDNYGKIYNDSAMLMDHYLMSFPTKILAPLMKISKKEIYPVSGLK